MYKDIYQFLETYLLKLSNAVIFEFGVNEAQDTIKMLSLLHHPFSYFGFEPDPMHFKTIEESGVLNKISFIKSAIGNYNGEVILYQSMAGDKNTGSSSIHKPLPLLTEIWPHISFPISVKVPVITLDSFCDQNNIDHIDFIWADIQGAESDMIKGGQKILQNTSYIYIEHYESQIYENQLNLNDTMKLLPGKWELIQDFGADALIKNMDL